MKSLCAIVCLVIVGEPAASITSLPSLLDTRGSLHHARDLGLRPTVLIFASIDCPVNNLYWPILNQLSSEFPEARFVAIHVGNLTSKDQVEEHRKEYAIEFPALLDVEGTWSDHFAAERTPEVFLLNRGEVVYRGRIDDRHGYVHRRGEPSRFDLKRALEHVRTGTTVSVSRTEAVGCLISRPTAHSAAAPTYARDIARVMQNKCQSCHRPNGAAPFSLLGHADAFGRRAAIKEAIGTGRMPPWHADGRHGRFANDRSLNHRERTLLNAWIDGGAPLGNPDELPPPREFPDQWTIGVPDLVFKMPRLAHVPAAGVLPYRYFRSPTNLKEDVWVRGAEALPGNRKVVHHLIVFVDDSPGHDFDPQALLRRGFLVGYAPGDLPMSLPEGTAKRIPAGSHLVWQVHYTPTGSPQTDLSQVGLILHKGPTPPRQVATTRAIMNQNLSIPPGVKDHRHEAVFRFGKDAMLLSLSPHMHLRGKDFLMEAIYPNLQRETLLFVPRYDFNWQTNYRLARPLMMPEGTTIRCVAHFDNSAGNPSNPDPTTRVTWGDQNTDEMAIGWIDYAPISK